MVIAMKREREREVEEVFKKVRVFAA